MKIEREERDNLIEEEISAVEDILGYKITYIVIEDESQGDTYEVSVKECCDSGIGVVGESDTIYGAILDFKEKYEQSVKS